MGGGGRSSEGKAEQRDWHTPAIAAFGAFRATTRADSSDRGKGNDFSGARFDEEKVIHEIIRNCRQVDIESIREYCLSLPQVTERVQWGNDLVFKIAGKMFAVTVLEGASKYCLSFKCTEEKFAELIEQDGIDPAPYSARW